MKWEPGSTKYERTLTYNDEDLEVIWKTKTWDDILFFKDKNHSFLKGLYEYLYFW